MAPSADPAAGDAARWCWRRAFGDSSSVLATAEQNAESVASRVVDASRRSRKLLHPYRHT